MKKLFSYLFLILGLSTQAQACTSVSINHLNTGQYSFAQAQCGSAYIQTTLYLSGGQAYLSSTGNGAISACWFIYAINGQQWMSQPLGINNYQVQIGPGPVGTGYLFGMACTQFDGTYFGVYAGPCDGINCGSAVVF